MSSERGECDVILLSSGYCMMISHAFAKSNPFLCFYADNDAVDDDVDDSDDDDDNDDKDHIDLILLIHTALSLVVASLWKEVFCRF